MSPRYEPKSSKERKQQAGHQEIHGETIAKFEFFERGWNPYSRYLDIDKVDLILRKRTGRNIKYVEVQVKFGRLYEHGTRWQEKLFDATSFRFFKLDEFARCNNELYIAYVLSRPGGYKGDIFIFPIREFEDLLGKAIHCNTEQGRKAKLHISRERNGNRWFVWRKSRFDSINDQTSVEVSQYWQNFQQIRST